MTFDQAILEPSREITASLTTSDLTIDDDYIESIKITQSLLTGSSFEIGTAVSSRIVATLLDYDGVFSSYDFTNKEFKLEIGILVNDTIPYTEIKTIGYFTVDQLDRKDGYITLKAGDRMYKFNNDFNDDLTYPASMSQILQRVCEQAGVSLAGTDFANSTYSTEQISYYGISMRKIVESIAELAGGYAIINSSGYLEIIHLELADPSPKAITDENYIEFTINEVANSSIDLVTVKVGEVSSSFGSGSNEYVIANNIFVQNPADVVENIYNVINGLSYAPISIVWQGDFGIPVGKSISITNDAQTLNTYLLVREMNYDGGFEETSKSPSISNVIKNNAVTGSTKVRIEQLSAQIKILQDEISLLVEETGELGSDYSSLSVRVDGIDSTVSNHTGQISTINQTINGIETSISDIEGQIAETIFKETIDGFEITKSVLIGPDTYKIASIKSAFDENNDAYITIDDGGNDVATIRSNNMSISSATIKNYLVVGQHKITYYDNGGEMITIVQMI